MRYSWIILAGVVVAAVSTAAFLDHLQRPALTVASHIAPARAPGHVNRFAQENNGGNSDDGNGDGNPADQVQPTEQQEQQNENNGGNGNPGLR